MKTKFLKTGFFICTIVILLSACKKEKFIFKNEFQHTWQLAKYEEDGIDKTQAFDSVYHNYTIVFDNVKNYYTDEYDDVFHESFYHHKTLYVEYFGFFTFTRPNNLSLIYNGTFGDRRSFKIQYVNKTDNKLILEENTGLTTKIYTFYR